jgi:tRNA threonylcarbamoyladenosine biosynthesis protein TsaE
MNPIFIDVQSLAETEVLGRRLGAHLFPGAIVALVGTLGAGKTHLVRAIAEGLDIPNPAVVNSPTFVLIQEYDARLPIYHFDAYRLASEAEFVDLGVHEYFQGNGVCLIEWADKVPTCLPKERLDIRITITGDQTRCFELAGTGQRYVAITERMVPFFPPAGGAGEDESDRA